MTGTKTQAQCLLPRPVLECQSQIELGHVVLAAPLLDPVTCALVL